MTVVAAATLTTVVSSPPVAHAAVVNPLTVQYDKAVFGDFTIAGNVVTTCPTSPAWFHPDCAVGRSSNSSALPNTYINDQFYMEYVDVDGDASTFNSSTARFTIPAGATIDYARLWWVGNTGEAKRSNGAPYFACNASQPNTATPNLATAPPGFPNNFFVPSSHPVKVKIGGGSYQSITPERLYRDAAPTNGGRHYQATADVKTLISAQPTGVPIDITVGNIWTPKGNNCTGGFALTFVWKFPNPDPTYAPQARQVLVFDGFVAQGAADPPTTTSLTGFTLAAGTRRLGVGIIEGDQGITGDQMIANGVALADPRITPPTTTNYNASTVDGMQNPIYPNSLGLDAKTREVSPTILPDGLTSVPLTFTTSGDQYFPFLFAFSAPIVTNFLSGMVWNDTDGDGVLDPGEAPIPGTTITLTGTDATGAAVNRTTTTGAGGGYRFDGITNGTYTVTETQPTNYSNSPGTTTTQYVSNVRSGIVFNSPTATGVTNVNFAEIQSSISGVVYHDQDNSGAKNGAEPGIGGVTVTLTGTDANGNPVGLTTTTAADGSYSFPNLAAGTYVITETQPSGWGDGAETVGSSGGSAATNDKFTAVTLAAGTAATGYNFGEKKTSVAGNVYVDTDNDGVKDAGEAGIGGVTVALSGVTEAGAPVNLSTVTAADGSYSFANLVPGTYTLTETQPAAYGDGIDTVGTVGGVATGSVANDVISSVVLSGAGPGVDYNFGERPGTVTGLVWYDANRDGIRDVTETPIAGVTITLTKPDLTTVTTTTAADGTYSFTGLAGGNYTITETQPAGYGSSTPNSLTPVTVPAGGTVANQNFGDTLSTLSGRVYVDGNANSAYNAGEAGIPNTTVTLKNGAGATVATTTTASDGTYSFTGIPAGTYSVVETQPPFMTDAAETAGTPTNGSTATNDTISAITVGAAVDLVDYNFGELGANVSGFVWSDLDNDGVKDAGEPGIPGVAMTLEARVCRNNTTGAFTIPSAGGTCPVGRTIGWYTYDNATTGADGSYVFLGNDPNAVYRVLETQPTNYADGTEDPGTNGTSPANDQIQIGLTNYTVVLGAGGSVDNNFGELSGEVSGYTYYDDENDALRTGDTAIAGVLVTLADGTSTWTTTTDATGYYQFVGLPITAGGITYTLTETQPSSYFDGQESSTGTINPGGVNDKISVSLTTGARVKSENNFGERLGSISGQVWYDADGDGVKDVGETTGIPTTVDITDGAGNVIVANHPTLPDGTWTYGGLPPGSYTVTEDQPAGYGSSTANDVAVTLNTITVTGINFGEILGSIAGSVYVDTNRNGVRDPGEAGISGVSVTLTKPDTSTVTMGTDASGNYLFTALPAGSYRIDEAQPALYNDGSETVGTTGGTLVATDRIDAITLDAGENAVAYLFGELSPSVEGTVYYDADRDGVQDPGENGIPGVTVTITGPGGVNLTTSTDINGDYIFPSVPTGGGYTITETQPAGYGSSQQPTNSISSVTVPLAGLTGQDFGDTLGTLAGTVFRDGDNDGVQDAGESGISGVTVEISGLSNSGLAISMTTTTDASGNYLFTDLPAGTYAVAETQPAAHDDGKDTPGTVTAGASGVQDGFVNPDQISTVVLAVEDDGVDYDFGEIGTFISGTVFRDIDRNGVYDASIDQPMSGVTVELFDSGGGSLGTRLSGADGSYRFDDLPAGDYTVTESQPPGFADTTGAAGPNTRNVTAPAGGLTGVDFGEVRASVAGSVWVDIDRDGVRDYTPDGFVIDPPIAGVTVTLVDGNPLTPDPTAVTDGQGRYFFDNLAPGTYSVVETHPAAWVDSIEVVGSMGGSTAVNDTISGIVLAAGDVGTAYDFVEIGSNVAGTVWLDRSNDGVIDAAETVRLPGVTVTLDDGNPLTTDRTTTTDASGNYLFDAVPNGSYTVVETQPAGYASTVPNNDQLAITVAGADLANQNFGEILGSIGDLIWNDLDGDGIVDAGEPGIPGVVVTATATIGGTPYSFTATTDVNGLYSIPDLLAGTWTVTVDTATLPTGLTATHDADGTGTPHVSVVTLTTSSLVSTTQDFGYQGAGSLGDLVWNDLDADGVQDAGEPGLPAVDLTITTVINGTTVTYTTTTDATGAYSLTGLPLGSFTVTVDTADLPLGMTETYDADGVASPDSSTVTLAAGSPASTTQDFGYQGAGSIGDFVWLDANGDGVQDGEPGIGGVDLTITTVVNGTTLTYTATTDAAGAYSVTGLPLGAFTVTVDPASLPGGAGPTTDFDGVGTPNASTVSLTVATPANAAQDFGYDGPGAIGDLVWLDFDGDGSVDPGEPGLGGVTVTATATINGTPMTFTTTTSPSGAYAFAGLPLGTWTVTVDPATLPGGVVNTGDPDGGTAGQSVVTLTAGTPSNNAQDFGYQGLGGLGDTVWNDLDSDGIQDPGEPGLPGVTVTASVVIAGTTITRTATTGPTGTYAFTGLPYGSWTVAVDPATLPAGMTAVFDADGVGTPHTSTVVLDAMTPTSLAQDFGYLGAGSIGDVVWLDVDGDGVQDAGEPGLAGVTVTVSTVIAGTTLTYTTTTDAAGAYLRPGLPLGAYDVVVDPATLPAGVDPTFDADGGLDDTSAVTLTVAVPAVTDQDFGYEGVGSIGDLVWLDLDGDGTRDPGEPGLPGVTVTATATIGGVPMTFTTTTDPTGAYLFAGLPLAAWTIAVDPTTLPGGLTATDDRDGTLDDTAVVTLTAGTPSVTDADFAYQGAGSIGDFVWLDNNGDGVQDAGEPGIPGVDVTVSVVIAGTTLTFPVTTDAAGAYSVTGLPHGTYTVVVDPATLPAGVVATFDADGGADDTSVVTLDAVTPTSATQDFGYQGPGSIGDHIWLDLDGDGVVDPGEPGLEGVDVTITIQVNGSPMTWTVTTDANGDYLVAGLPLGDFNVAVDTADLPAGVVNTGDPDGATADESDVTLTAVAPTTDTQDFGYQGPGSIGDLVWNDLDGDGTHDAGEPGLPGVTVTATITVIGRPYTLTTTTDATGAYLFTGLPLGDWTVTVDGATLPGGLTNTGDPDGGADGTSVVTLTVAAPADLAQDFGYQGAGEIGDLVWIDVDGDGVVDAGEPGLQNADITLTTTINGTPVSYLVTTDASGAYSVAGLPLGTYTVAVDPASMPAGVSPTFDSDGVGTPDVSTVTLDVVTPISLVEDFGYRGPGHIGDHLWLDLNGDGVVDAGEPALAAVTVTITTTVAGVPVSWTTTTDLNGDYAFDGLPLGAYTVTIDTATLPAGVVNTGDPDGGNDDTSAITLTAAVPSNDAQDFGYQGIGSLGDLVWNDLDGDGAADPGEPGLPGVTVTVSSTVNGLPVTFTTTTDPTGAWTIDGLPLGAWTVTVDPATLPLGLTNTGDPDGGADGTAVVTLDAATPDVDTADFGYQGAGSIGDLVWADLDGDGITDAGEQGLAGVDLLLSTTINGAVVTYPATTDATGAYSVTGLPLGDYTVTVDVATLPAGVAATFDSDGGNDDTSAVTLTVIAPASTTQDFGYQGAGSIGDLVWNDLDGDGLVDPGEPGIPGVTVTVTATIGGVTFSATAVTDATGAYLITGLPLGTFDVTVDTATLPGGMNPTFDADGGNDHTSTVTLSAAAPASTTQDFGYQGAGSIGDVIWNDLDGDGLVDPGEPGLPGVDVVIVTTIAGTPVTYTATTDAAGRYVLDGIPLGSYTVTPDVTDLPAGLAPTFDSDGGNDGTSTVVLSPAAPTSDLEDFGYRGPGSIGDFVWNDLDADGVQDAGEPGLPAVDLTITTVVNGTTVTYSATTDATGAYSLAGLPLGDFTVTVDAATLPAGVVQTFDADGTGTGDTSDVTLTLAAPNAVDQDFGYTGDGAIGDFVWVDNDGDGVQDPGEPGIPGVTVTITAVVGGSTVTWTDVTDASGAYLVAGLPTGSFTVTVDTAGLPAGLVNTGDPDGGNDDTADTTLTNAAPSDDTVDFGYQGPGMIGDLVWNDLDGDGVQDPGEPGLPGVDITVTLTVNGLPVTWTTTTGPTGAWSIDGLPLGDYLVTVDPATLPAAVVNTGDPDATFDGSTVVTLTAAAPTLDTVDFGYRGPGGIGDTIWLDLDGDGVQDAGEPPLAGVDVTITTTIGGSVVLYSAQTDLTGNYLVSGLPLGDYDVRVDPATLPAGSVATFDADGTGTANQSLVTLDAAVPSNLDQDFGYNGPGMIGDLVWNDLDGDGMQDPGEPGLPGVTVTLTTTINGVPVTVTAVTDPSGAWSVDGLPLGDWTVTPDPATLPAGVNVTGDPDGAPDGTTTVTLTALVPTDDTADFGYQGPGSLGDTVWLDLDGDGVQDAGEPGIPGVDVTIVTTIGGSPVTYSVTTDAAGQWTVTGLPLGDYAATVDPATLPAGVANTGDPDATLDGSTLVTLTAAAPVLDTVDFGYQGPGIVGDLVWNDLDGDGVQDPGEPGLPGVTVTLTTTINGVPVTVTVTTDPTGAWTASGLPLGNWTVTVDPATLPAGVVVTGDPDATPDGSTTVTLTAAAPLIDTVDFGYQGPGSIGDLVWNDLDGDGTQDPGEPGLPGVGVTITTTINGVVVTYSATTDAAGAYLVDGLPLGDFTVTIDPATLPAGVVNTGDPDGGNDDTSDVTLTVATPADVDQDFGYQGPGSLGDLVWNDLNGDSVQDPGEPGIPGVDLTIVTTVNGSPVTYSVTTDPTGAWSIAGLPLGSFGVTVDVATLPAGVVNTGDPDGTPDDTTIVSLTAPAPTADTVDFGYQGPGTLGDVVWLDLNGDGVQDPGEPGLPGVTVTVTTTIAGSPVTYSAVTDPTGTYLVDGLPLGDFDIAVDVTTLPAGSAATFDADGGNDDISAVTLTAATPDDLAQDFGYQGPGSIGDLVWNDLNGDGVQDPGEPGLPGVTITLTTTINGVPVSLTTVTDPTGAWTVDGLPLGDWTVTVDPATLPLGMTNTGDPDGTADGSTVVTLATGTETVDTADFGYQGIGSLGDLLWLDLNGDGLADAGEPGLPGAVLTVTTVVAGTTLIYTVTTGADGSYLLAGLPLGDYVVTVDPATLPAGVVATFDADGGLDGTSSSTLTLLDPAIDTQDFGYRGPGAVGDLIWNDVDNDGIIDPGEPGIPGVTITATTTINGVTVTIVVQTGPDGVFGLPGLPFGTWTLTVDPTTLPPGVNPSFDSDGIVGTPNSSVVTLTPANPTPDTEDFGYTGPGEIGDLVWNDLDRNGVQDPGEPGLPGVSITLTTVIAGIPVDYPAATGPDGSFLAVGLPLGTWTVTVDATTLPPGVVATFDGDDPADGSIATPDSSLLVLTAADPIDDAQDFGYAGPGEIGDLVWNDLDGDGVADDADPGLGSVDVTITLMVNGSPVVYPATTDSDGVYLVTGLPLGDYVVSIDQADVPGYTPSFDLDGIATPFTTDVALTMVDPIDDTADFGQFLPVSIGDLIWEDLDGDGLQDAGEPGVDGVVVTLAGTDGLGNPVSLTTTTGAPSTPGAYLFGNVAPGEYSITVTPPAGWEPSVEEAGSDPAADSDGLQTPVTVRGGTDQLTIDTGIYRPVPISGLVFGDSDADGLPDTGEPGIPGVTVRLTGTTGAGTPLELTMVTLPGGVFAFDELPPGSYSVAETQPAAWADGAESAPGGISIGTDSFGPIVVTSGNPVAGLAYGELGWDVSGSVTFDGTDAPIPGVVLRLQGTDVLGNPVDLTFTTDDCGGVSTDCIPGAYVFRNVPPGTYTLIELQPDGLNQGQLTPGDVIEIVLSGGPSFGNRFSETGSSISGVAYIDTNANGVRDADEPPLPEVRITLTGTDATGTPVFAEVVTDTQGRWSFLNLKAGTYVITETQPEGLKDGQVNLGSAGGETEPNVIKVTIAAGITAINYAFGDVPQGSGGKIPKTGTDIGGPLGIGAGLAGLGLALVVIARRRRRPVAIG